MPSPFDGLQGALINTVNALFSTPASYTPSSGGGSQTAKVLFKRPTHENDLNGYEYNPRTWIMEYYEGSFPSLKTLVDANDTNEIVTIESAEYYVKVVSADFDGKTYKAVLEKKS